MRFIKRQERVIFGAGSPEFIIDLVLYDERAKQPLRVKTGNFAD
jgi:hypothetical protein